MSQSTLIAMAVVLLFLVYIAARGRLPSYMKVFGLARGAGGDSTTDGGGGTGFAPNVPFGPTWWDNFLRPWRGG